MKPIAPRALLVVPIAAVLAGWAMAAGAQDDDPLQSPACRRALEVLDAQQRERPATEGAASAPASRARLQVLRREASVACLGTAPDRAPQRARLQTPIEVAPPAPAPAARRPATAAPPAVPRVAAPAVITSCDANGCWASDGSRLQRMGPDLVGPRGVCSVQGAVLNCPSSR